MQEVVKGTVLPTEQLPPGVRSLVERETESIRVNFKKTVQGIIEVGQSLARLKQALPRSPFLEHIRHEFSMNEMAAHRFIVTAKKFSDSTAALAAKPSVLFLLAGAEDLSKVKQLASGGSITLGNKKVKLADLTVEDAKKIRLSTKKSSQELSPAQADKKRMVKVHEELGELCIQTQDYCADLSRWSEKNLEIENKKLLVETLRETKTAIDACIKVLSQ